MGIPPRSATDRRNVQKRERLADRNTGRSRLLIVMAEAGARDADIALALGVSASAVVQRRHALGIPTNGIPRGTWTAEADEIIRREYRRGEAAALAARLGVTLPALYSRAASIGAVTKLEDIRWDVRNDERVREMHAAGWSATRMATAFGTSHSTVLKRMIALGLPRLTPADIARRNHEAARRGEVPRWGTGKKTHREKAKRLAAEYGLPAELRLREVQIVLLLIEGPSSRAELARRMGIQRPNSLITGVPGKWGFYLPNLVSLGLIASARLPGGNCLVYTLTARCLDLLASQGRATHGG